MNKAALIKHLSQEVGITKRDAEKAIDTLVETIIKELKQGNEVSITGFGTFIAKKRHARMGVNPQKPNEKIQQPATVVPKFKAGKTLKDALKKA